MTTYLPPVERPGNPVMRLVYWFSRRQFGVVAGPVAVFAARMPLAFLAFYGKVARLDRKLRLPRQTAVAIRERVATLNGCLFCQDAARYYELRRDPTSAARLDELDSYRTSALFSKAERAALDYATELAGRHHVEPETFARLRACYSEREVCDIAWLVASEHVWNITNIGLNIGSDGLCELHRATSPVPAAR
jgi:alkylhydroperoxidase family enzyme